jgi:hypothetical protein
LISRSELCKLKSRNRFDKKWYSKEKYEETVKKLSRKYEETVKKM